MSLLPSKPDLVPSTEPRVVGVDSEDADALMSALSSGTARCLLSELHDEPAPPSELADRAGTTLQNTQYHLANLREAGAVEVVGTAYSEKGREMDVYAPADRPLVIFAGQDDEASGLRAALSRLVGGVGALLVGSLAVQEVFGDGVGRLVGFGTTGSGLDDGASGDPAAGGGATTDTDTGSPPPDGTSTADAAPTGSGGGDGGTGGEAGTATPQADAAGTPSPTSGDATAATRGDAGGDATGTAVDTATEAPEAADAATTATSTATPTPTPEATQFASDGGIDALASLPPGALFFLGGLVVLVVAVALTAGR